MMVEDCQACNTVIKDITFYLSIIHYYLTYFYYLEDEIIIPKNLSA